MPLCISQRARNLRIPGARLPDRPAFDRRKQAFFGAARIGDDVCCLVSTFLIGTCKNNGSVGLFMVMALSEGIRVPLFPSLTIRANTLMGPKYVTVQDL